MKIVHNSWLSDEHIKKVEDLRHAKYICDSCEKGKDGNWVNLPFAYFYTEESHPEGSNYFALYQSIFDNSLYITNGIGILDQDIVGVVADNGDVIYSSHRWDYVISPDESVVIDGGRDYVKTNNPNRKVTLKVVKDELKVMEE